MLAACHRKRSCSCWSCVPKVLFMNSVTALFTASGIAFEPGLPSMGLETVAAVVVLKAPSGVSAASGLCLLRRRLLLFGFILHPFDLIFVASLHSFVGHFSLGGRTHNL